MLFNGQNKIRYDHGGFHEQTGVMLTDVDTPASNTAEKTAAVSAQYYSGSTIQTILAAELFRFYPLRRIGSDAFVRHIDFSLAAEAVKIPLIAGARR